jgi:hypothetical protein
MPMVTCPSCGEDTFTVTGWADIDRCPYCGRPLMIRKLELDPVFQAKQKLTDRPQKLDRGRH